jgi:hypothetical protein
MQVTFATHRLVADFTKQFKPLFSGKTLIVVDLNTYMTRVTRLDCEKVAQNIAQTIFCQNLYITGAVEKRSPDTRVTSVIFKPLPKENNHPLGEFSPNLVTLYMTFC